jgi:hypothetical protein
MLPTEKLICSDNVGLTSLSKVPHNSQKEDEGHSTMMILGNGWEWQVVDEATYQTPERSWVASELFSPLHITMGDHHTQLQNERGTHSLLHIVNANPAISYNSRADIPCI